MSYEIVYSRNFIKTNRGILPLVLTGSNNDYTWTGRRWRRSRSWACFYGNKHMEISADDLMLFFSKKADSNENYDFCDFRGKRLYYNDALKFYEQGIKGAQTIEDYIAHGNFTRKGKYKYRVSGLNCYVSVWKEHENTHELKEFIKTTSDLENWLDRAKNFVKGKKDNYICVEFDSDEVLTFDKQTKIKGACLLKNKASYVVSFENGTLTTSKDKKRALVFNNEVEAQKMLEAIKAEYSVYYCSNFKLVNFDANKKEPVKNCYVRIDKYNTFARFCKYGYRYYCAIGRITQALMTEKKATQVLEKLQRLYGDKHTFEIVKEGA